MNLTGKHRDLLAASAITDEVLRTSGIRSTPTGIDFPWGDGNGPLIHQHRPDTPGTDKDGNPVKYLFPKGAKVPFNRLRDGSTYRSVLLVEGTKQQYTALSHAPADFAVYGMSGCWGFGHADFTVMRGRDVFVLLDADVETNISVWAAADALLRKLRKNGAASARLVTTTGTGKEGLDDVLASYRDDAERAEMLRLWLSQAETKMPKKPARKTPTEGASRFFRVRKEPLVLHPNDLAEEILATFPAAITPEKNIALYENGVYKVDQDAILSVVVRLLNEYFTPSSLKTAELFVRGLLKARGKVLPDFSPYPLMNAKNGMVDLRTGKLLPHDPCYLSSSQSPVEYLPDAPAPVYDAWIRSALRREGATEAEVEELVRDLEETVGTMLDPSRTPSKALFLFGPARSGKSTLLRLLKAIAGAENTSAETLHDLVSDPFAKANLYGKTLNVAADLSSRHLEDLSVFKMILGEDVIKGNRKYGQQFTFTSRALVAFSANELPTVSEASRAYAERVRPFEFPNTFAGHEDKNLEPKLMAELPGILARWVRGYQRFLARGGYGPQDAATMALFEARSDRVVQFFQDMCEASQAREGQVMAPEMCTVRRDVAFSFNEWAKRNGGSAMGERSLFARLEQIPGVVTVRRGSSGTRAFNFLVRSQEDDSWGDDEPVADPVEGTGITGDAAEEVPWFAPVSVPDREEAREAAQDDGIPRLRPVSAASPGAAQAAFQAPSWPLEGISSVNGSHPDEGEADPMSLLFPGS